MPKDTRIWMTFPINFWMHPKIRPLSDAAFRAFVEINGYSRMEDLDGRVPVALAKTMWRQRALGELLKNHPDRPSLLIDGDDYVIWNYDEHQETRATREARQATNTANGKLGGRPRKNRPETHSVTERVSVLEPGQNQSQSQESEIDLTDRAHLPESSPESDARAGGSDGESALIFEAHAAGITDLKTVRKLLGRVIPGELSPRAAVELTRTITARASGEVRDVDAYVAVACRNTPDEVRWHYERLDLGAQP